MTGQLMVHAHKAPPEWENQRPSTLPLKGSMQRIKRVFCPLRQLLSLHLASVRITGSEDGLAIGSRINVVRVGGCATGTDKCNNSTECSPRESSNGYRLLGPVGSDLVRIVREHLPPQCSSCVDDAEMSEGMPQYRVCVRIASIPQRP